MGIIAQDLEFQSTLSLRRATQTPENYQALRLISIHALLAESDSIRVFTFAYVV